MVLKRSSQSVRVLDPQSRALLPDDDSSYPRRQESYAFQVRSTPEDAVQNPRSVCVASATSVHSHALWWRDVYCFTFHPDVGAPCMPAVTDTRGTEWLKHLVADMGLSVEGSSQKALASLASANSISA